jgi:hypothetical protein
MEYLEGLHQKHEDWLWGGVPADTWVRRHTAPDSSSSSDGGGGSGSGLYVPQQYQQQQQQQAQQAQQQAQQAQQQGLLVPNSIQGQLYFLQRSPALPQLLNGTPALVLDCNQDVLHDEDRKADFQDKVLSYIAFMKEYRKQQEEAGVSPRQRYGSSSGSGVGVSRVPVSPGAPACPDMQQHVDTVQEVSRESAGMLVVPANSGAALEVTGGLEALTNATLGVWTGGDPAAAAAGASGAGKPSSAALAR